MMRPEDFQVSSGMRTEFRRPEFSDTVAGSEPLLLKDNVVMLTNGTPILSLKSLD